MSKFLDWRKMTWALVVWSAYVAIWTALTGSGPALFTLWWLAGTIVVGSLWFATQLPFQQGVSSTVLLPARLDEPESLQPRLPDPT